MRTNAFACVLSGSALLMPAAFLAGCGSGPERVAPAAAVSTANGVPTPPVAKQEPYVVKSPFGDRTDEYYWVRDDDANKKRERSWSRARRP